jgi:hypothetical protein
MWSSCLALLLFSAAHSAMLLGGVMLLTTDYPMPRPPPACAWHRGRSSCACLAHAGRPTDRKSRRRLGRCDWGTALRRRDRDLAVYHRARARLFHRLTSGPVVYRRRRGIGHAESVGCTRHGALASPVGGRISAHEYRAAIGNGAGHHRPDDDLPTQRRPCRCSPGLGIRRRARRYRRARRGNIGVLVETRDQRVSPGHY